MQVAQALDDLRSVNAGSLSNKKPL